MCVLGAAVYVCVYMYVCVLHSSQLYLSLTCTAASSFQTLHMRNPTQSPSHTHNYSSSLSAILSPSFPLPQASATRAVLNGGIRLGLYDPIKTLMSADGSGRDLHMGQKLAAGSLSGGIGAVLTTPIELAKTRLQVCGLFSSSYFVF